ncbi:winged helix-turn-helix domain-containing protein [Streptomyces calidiresistens]
MSGPAYERIAATYRERIHAGDLRPGERLPAQQAMIRAHGVGRDTVRRAIEVLRAEGLLEPGVPGRAAVVAGGSTPAEPLEHHLTRVFRAPRILLEAREPFPRRLSEALLHRAGDIARAARAGAASRSGRENDPRPESIRLRLLIPDPAADLPFPHLVGDPRDPRPRLRHRGLLRTYAGHIEDTLLRLKDDGLVPDVRVEVRGMPHPPTEAHYLLNDTTALTAHLHPRQTVVTDRSDGTLMRVRELYGEDRFFVTVRDRRAGPAEEELYGRMLHSFEAYWQEGRDVLGEGGGERVPDPRPGGGAPHGPVRAPH